MKKHLIITAIVASVLGGYFFITYNSLVGASVSVDSQWAKVETVYQERFNLIPALVQTVKGFAKQEQTIFADIAEARTRYSGATSVDDRVKAANQVESVIGRLLVIAEAYPDLKSSQNFSQLSVSFEGIENRVRVERNRFNDEIKDYNLLIKRVPSSWVASYFAFVERDFFQASDGAEDMPEVQF